VAHVIELVDEIGRLTPESDKRLFKRLEDIRLTRAIGRQRWPSLLTVRRLGQPHHR
jgi:hypothetical protein